MVRTTTLIAAGNRVVGERGEDYVLILFPTGFSPHWDQFFNRECLAWILNGKVHRCAEIRPNRARILVSAVFFLVATGRATEGASKGADFDRHLRIYGFLVHIDGVWPVRRIQEASEQKRRCPRDP